MRIKIISRIVATLIPSYLYASTTIAEEESSPMRIEEVVVVYGADGVLPPIDKRRTSGCAFFLCVPKKANGGNIV